MFGDVALTLLKMTVRFAAPSSRSVPGRVRKYI
jgi:hypothetical protein